MKSADRTRTTDTPGLTRRAFVAAAGAGAVLASGAGAALAGSHEGHEGHGGHAGHGGHGGHAGDGDGGDHAGHAHGHNEALAEAALDCVGKGNTCIEHCIVQLRAGNEAMADCAAAVQEMTAACTGLARLAALDSEHLPKYAAVCLEICKDCEAECRKHEKMHAICKACAESCKACIAECEKIAA